MLKGLQYVGNANGILVMLYKSYKTVEVTWDKPYHFTKKDNVSEEAKKYYQKQYRPLGIKIVEEVDADTEPAKIPEFKPEEVEIPKVQEEEIKVEANADTAEVEDNSLDKTAAPDEDDSSESDAELEDVEVSDSKVLDKILSEIKSTYDRETISSLTELDLGSLLDEKLDEDQVKELAKKLDYDYGRTRNKSKIISGLVSSKLSDVVEAILK